MNGELDFAASLNERVALLKGVPADVFEKLKPMITITPGARQMCKALKRLGFKLAVLSGGFQPLADWLKGQLGLDYAFANHVCRLLLILHANDRLDCLGCFAHVWRHLPQALHQTS